MGELLRGGGDCDLGGPFSSDEDIRGRLVAESAVEDSRRFVIGDVGGEGTITADATGLGGSLTYVLDALEVDLRAYVWHCVGSSLLHARSASNDLDLSLVVPRFWELEIAMLLYQA